ncbi:MAG: HlyD family efflux transporter periplasmic adaptor subunit [Candidatus Competibacterales bacterium]|nr:HlyD family efflux transporter periplasmic adaptor subunit [Candidatus Competibacterales bacterium]
MSAEVPPPLAASLADHDREGIEILAAEPSRLIHGTIWLLVGLLLTGVAWSVFGSAGVVVKAQGRLGPEAEERLVFVPIEGQLTDLYIAEGTPVAAGDVIARINALGAMQLAASAQMAELKLQDARAAYQAFPLQKQAMEQGIALLEYQIRSAEQGNELRQAQGMTRLADEQRLKLDAGRLKLDEAQNALAFARDEYETHRRLFESPGGGGIARKTVEDKFKEYQNKLAAAERAQIELAEFEVKLNEEFAKRQEELSARSERVLQLRAQLAERRAQLASAEREIETALRMAQAEAASAARISFDDIDEDSLLQIKAPVAGVITQIGTAQPGAKVDPKTPLAGIAPADARNVLHIEIVEQDRALLRVGMPVRIKFNAFPYQRFGFIDGTLEFIAPSAVPSANSSPQNRLPVYKGRVVLTQDHFTLPGSNDRIPLRYGMIAVAEIVVQHRRLFDLALDPLRAASG